MTYRPDDSALSSFEEVLKPNYIQALTLNKPIIILGDLNCNGLEKSCSKFKALEKFCSEMNLKQLISTPTRITPHTQTLLDVIMVSPNCSVSNSGVIHRPISDHSIVFAKLKIKKQKTVPQYVTTRSYKHYNGKQFACDLAKEADALLTTFDKPDVDSKLENLMDTLQHTLDSHAPQKQIKICGRPCPFVNKEIKDMMKFRDILLKKFVQTHDEMDWCNFKQSRDRVKKMLRDAENNYTFHDVQANKNSPRALWKIINRAVPSNSPLIVLLYKRPVNHRQRI